MKHYVEDDIVGEAHSVGTEGADVVNGLLDVAADNAFAIAQSASLAGSNESIDRRADAGSNLGGATALRSVAYYSRNRGQSRFYGHFYLLGIASVKIGQRAAHSSTRSHSAAICRKASYYFLDMNRDEVGNEEPADESLVRQIAHPAELDNRQGTGHTLVSAAAGRHNRERTTVHSGIAACCSKGGQHVFEVSAIYPLIYSLANGLAYGDSIVSAKTFARNLRVELYDLVEKGLDFLQCYGVGRVTDVIDSEETSVGEFLFLDAIRTRCIAFRKLYLLT